jgi:GDPmannose 4,6-dehydratase
MLTLVEQDDVWQTVVGTGVAYPISRWLELCFGQVGLNWADHVRPVPGFRPEFDRLVSDPKTIRGLGWEPRVEIDELSRLVMQEVSALASA